jgi:uncharacterized protein YdeI (YjbR/CyaY-like superfamily)
VATAKPVPAEDDRYLLFADADEWAAWLAENCAVSPDAWLKIAKKGTGVTTVSYAEAVEVALCYGWIDSQMRRLDETYVIQRFSPRRARSPWSEINRGKAEQLIAAGKMAPSGLAEVERAKADGRWNAADERQ